MASTDATPFPIKNQAYRVTFPILDADGDLVTGASSLDSEVSKDGGTFADCTNEATEIATASGMYYLELTSTEMNADTVAIIVKSGNGKTTPIVLYPVQLAVPMLGVNVEQWNNTPVPAEHTAGYPVVTVKDGTGTGEIDTSGGAIATVTTLTNAPGDPSGVTTLLSRLSATRAGYLDNLSAGAVALEASVQSVLSKLLKYVQLIVRKDSAIATDNSTEVTAINANGGSGGGAFANTTDALEAQRDNIGTTGAALSLAKGTNITGFNDLSAAQVNTEVDTALTDYDAPTHTELTAELATADDATLAAIAALNNLSAAGVRSAIGLASANLDTQLAAIDDLIDTEVGTLLTDTASILTAVNTEIADIKAKTDQLTFTATNKLDVTLQAAGDLAAAVANKIADHIWRRTYANIRASANGDTLAFRSPLGAIAKLVNKWSFAAGPVLQLTHEDDVTVFGEQAVTTSPTAEPITSLDTS